MEVNHIYCAWLFGVIYCYYFAFSNSWGGRRGTGRDGIRFLCLQHGWGGVAAAIIFEGCDVISCSRMVV